jgi:hypothetical protein
MQSAVHTQIVQQIQRFWQFDIGGQRDVVLIAGSGRSGTTWVSNVIARATNSRTIFEPFLHDVNRTPVALARSPDELIDRHLFCPPGNTTVPRLDEFVTNVFRGRHRTTWSERESRPGIYRRRVVKGIRVNLLLGWIADRYPTLPIIWIVRNPISVIHSQWLKIQLGWNFTWSPEFALSQPQLMDQYLSPFADCIESADTLVQRLACKWCIETYVPLRQVPALQSVLQVRYEDLQSSLIEDQAWRGVKQHLGCDLWSDDYAGKAIRRLSFTSAQQPVAKLNHNFTEEQIDTIKTVVAKFGLTQFLDDQCFVKHPVPPHGLTVQPGLNITPTLFV